jgi:hypothetical protein
MAALLKSPKTAHGTDTLAMPMNHPSSSASLRIRRPIVFSYKFNKTASSFKKALFEGLPLTVVGSHL